MKKLKIITAITLLATISLADFNPKVNGYISNKIDLNKTVANGEWEFGKSALKISSKSGDVAFFSELAFNKMIDSTSLNDMTEYLWLDTPSPLGTLRFGKQKNSPKNINGGLASTSRFERETRIKDTGIGLLTEIAGIKTDIILAGGIEKNANSRIGIVAKLSKMLNVFAYTDPNTATAAKAEGVGVEVFYKDLGPTISGQVFLAGEYAFGATSIIYKVGELGLHAAYYTPLNDLTNALNTDRGKTELRGGITLDYHKNAFLALEYYKKEGGDDIYTLGAQVKF